jgi:PBP1b-binding outer membrane lipoprotein LpoB
MKRIMTVALFLILLGGCGGSAVSRRMDEVQAKNDALAARVKSLEDQLLVAQKQLIAHQQAMQTIRERQREMENYFDRMQVSQSR